MSGVLVDTSVWVEHFRRSNDQLVLLLEQDQVMMHPLVVGEVACGTPPNRVQTLADMGTLRQVPQASIGEVVDFIEREALYAMGCGIVDMMLLASTLMTPGVSFWTLDKRLAALADRMGIFYQPAVH